MNEIGELIQAARQTGLELRAEGERLILSGPSGAGEIAQELIARKSEVVAYMGIDRRQAAPREVVIDPSKITVSEFVRTCHQVFDSYESGTT